MKAKQSQRSKMKLLHINLIIRPRKNYYGKLTKYRGIGHGLKKKIMKTQKNIIKWPFKSSLNRLITLYYSDIIKIGQKIPSKNWKELLTKLETKETVPLSKSLKADINKWGEILKKSSVYRYLLLLSKSWKKCWAS